MVWRRRRGDVSSSQGECDMCAGDGPRQSSGGVSESRVWVLERDVKDLKKELDITKKRVKDIEGQLTQKTK